MRGGGVGLPGRVQHWHVGAVAACWGLLEYLGVAGIIDAVTGSRRSDAGASVGAYLVLAALNRVVAPCSKLAFADWWAKTAAPRFTRIPAPALDHRRFFDAAHPRPISPPGGARPPITRPTGGAPVRPVSPSLLSLT